jgi:hypothetical protein
MKPGRPRATRVNARWVVIDDGFQRRFFELSERGCLVLAGGKLSPHHIRIGGCPRQGAPPPSPSILPPPPLPRQAPPRSPFESLLYSPDSVFLELDDACSDSDEFGASDFQFELL